MGQRYGAQEHIGHARRRPIGIMIINTVASAAFFLLFGRVSADIAVIVVRPDKRHILRHLKAVVIQIQNLFIWNKGHHRIMAQRIP